jgi:hypothetical protein
MRCFCINAKSYLPVPSIIPPGTTANLVFSKIMCDFDGDRLDDIVTLWTPSQTTSSYICIYSPAKNQYIASINVPNDSLPILNGRTYEDVISCGKITTTNECGLLFGSIIITNRQFKRK